ncbi:MAG: HU family DNA-binding protein [Thermodesulfobacteriota bacterium]
MNKSQLIERMAQKSKLSHKEASSIVNTILNTMTEALAKGEGIEIRGFGSFTVKEYNAYKGRNPKTGEIIDVAPKKLPFFKVGKELRKNLNKSK